MDEKELMAKFTRWLNGVWYTFTFNPKDTLQCRKSKDRFGTFLRWFDKNRTVWDYGVKDLILYPDLSFPAQLGSGKYPRIHFHGIIMFHDVNTFLLQNHLDEFGYCEIDTISNHDDWIRYCEKYLRYVQYAEKSASIWRYTPSSDEVVLVKYRTLADFIPDDYDNDVSSEEEA